MSGRVGDLSSDQAEKLAQFKENLKDIKKDTYTDQHYLCFLRARNFNLKKSEEMFRKNAEWRVKHKMSTFCDDHPLPEAIAKYWPYGTSGIDKDGHLVVIIIVGQMDSRGLIYSMKASDRENVGMRIIEGIHRDERENSKMQGRYIEGSTFILDSEGLGPHFLWKPFLTLFNEMLFTIVQHYPGMIHRAFITRPPAIFPVAYSLVRPFLDEETRTKIKILKNNNKWQTTLLKYIDADQLPKYWGGSQVDPDGDPRCPSKIVAGGKVPDSYYMKDQLFEEEALSKIVISSGATKMLKYEIRVPESAIRYVFKTDDGDITFSIYKRNKASESKEMIMEEKKYNCHVIPVDGEVDAKTTGFYIFCFGNPSRLKSKTFSYQIEVLEPDEETLEKVEQADAD